MPALNHPLVLRTSQENEHTTSFGTCSEPVCRTITHAEDEWATDPSGCGHGVEAWPASGDNKGGVMSLYRIARKSPVESTLHKAWGTGKRGAYPRERGEKGRKMLEVAESRGVRSDCGSDPLKDGPVGWKVGRHRGRSTWLLGSKGEQNQGLRPGILGTCLGWHVRASLDLGWQAQMDTGGFGPIGFQALKG